MEAVPNFQQFTYPNIKNELGEVRRIAIELFPLNEKFSVKSFIEEVKKSKLVPLKENLWAQLENTDSYGISLGCWDDVKYHAVDGNPEHPRDWQGLKRLMEAKGSLEAPIILKYAENKYHLVSGNTRLMVARALGVSPQILLVDMSEQLN